LRIVRLSHSFKAGHVLFGDVRLLKEPEDVVLVFNGLALVLRFSPARLAHPDVATLPGELLGSDVHARKSCSNVPSRFLPAAENKIIAQETPDERERWSMAGQRIDRDELRAAIRKMGSEYVFYMLDDAITLLPQTKLRKLIAPYLNPAELRPDGARKESLLADVKAFEKASLAGKYYQAFAVNSNNYTEKSNGTLAWTADCRHLLERCVAREKKEDPKTVCQSFEIIFSLLSKIDERPDDLLFFADEGGSWEIGVDWETVLPAWFRVLSLATGPSEYSQRITTLLKRHYEYRRVKMLAAARRIATPMQRQALPKRERATRASGVNG
jgi:hypothetical protein